MSAPAPVPGPHESATTRARRLARKIAVGVIGGTILLLGVILTVTPGPSLVVVALGLAILATEFLWARRFLNKVHARIDRIRGRPPRDGTNT